MGVFLLLLAELSSGSSVLSSGERWVSHERESTLCASVTLPERERERRGEERRGEERRGEDLSQSHSPRPQGD